MCLVVLPLHAEVEIRLSVADREAFEQAANAAGLKISDWIRRPSGPRRRVCLGLLSGSRGVDRLLHPAHSLGAGFRDPLEGIQGRAVLRLIR